MLMRNQQFIDDVSARVRELLANSPARDLEKNMRAMLGAMFERLDKFNRANATIGRAYGLLSQNGQGSSVPGVTYMGSQGNNYAYNNVTFAENEERSPWEPFHVEKGFERDGDAFVVDDFKSVTQASTGAVLWQASEADKGAPIDSDYAGEFGHDLAMQAMGHGVSWFDDHHKFPLKVPHTEFYL